MIATNFLRGKILQMVGGGDVGADSLIQLKWVKRGLLQCTAPPPFAEWRLRHKILTLSFQNFQSSCRGLEPILWVITSFFFLWLISTKLLIEPLIFFASKFSKNWGRHSTVVCKLATRPGSPRFIHDILNFFYIKFWRCCQCQHKWINLDWTHLILNGQFGTSSFSQRFGSWSVELTRLED